MGVIISDLHYKKFQVTSTETIYLGESIELTDPEWNKIIYHVDHDIYFSKGINQTKIIWHFYSSSEPPIKGDIVWEEMQSF